MVYDALIVRQISIFMLGWIGYALTYFLRKPVGVVKTDMEAELHLSKVELGCLDTALFLPYALAQMFLGQIGDVYGARRVFGISLLLAALSMFSFGRWSSFPVFTVCLFLNGLAQSQCWPNCLKVLLSWFPDAHKNTAAGAFGTCAFAGGVGGTAMAVYLQTSYGWRSAFFLPSFLVGTAGLLVLIFFTHSQEQNKQIEGKDVNSKNLKNPKIQDRATLTFVEILKIPVVIELAVAVFCLKVVRYCIYMWFPMYLARQLHYSVGEAGMFSTTFDVGGVAGSILIGFIIDRYFQGKSMMGTGVSVLFSAICLLFFTLTSHQGLFLNTLSMFMAGFFNCGPDTLLGGAIPSQIGDSDGRNAGAAVTGFVNGTGSVGMFLEGPVFGLLVSKLGWSCMFYVLIILSVLAAVAIFRASSAQQKKTDKNSQMLIM